MLSKLQTLIIILSIVDVCRADDQPRIQGVAVKGRFLCGTKPLSQITVKIIDKDPGRDPDDLLDETLTDNDGRFTLSGATREVGDIEAAIKVYHDCDDEHRACQRKMLWSIPAAYNNNGTPHTWFDIGEINLELIFKEEERDCRFSAWHFATPFIGTNAIFEAIEGDITKSLRKYSRLLG